MVSAARLRREMQKSFGPPDPEKASMLYVYVRGLQLEGRYPRDVGLSPLTPMRVRMFWGSVPYSAWPNEPDAPFPPAEPAGLDAKARALRIDIYHRVRTSMEAVVALFGGLTFNVALRVTRAWLQGGTTGEIPMPAPGEEFIGEHAVFLTGYENGRFRFDNSWGERWGDGGCGWLPFEYFERFNLGAFLPMSNRGTAPTDTGDGVQLCGRTPFGHELRAFFIDDPQSGERAAWAMAVARDGYLDVEDLFVMPGFRRRGHAVRLAVALHGAAVELAMPLRAWVTYGDADRSGIAGVRAVARLLDLELEPASASWARFVGTKYHPAGGAFQPRQVVPAASAHVRGTLGWRACSSWLAAGAGLRPDTQALLEQLRLLRE